MILRITSGHNAHMGRISQAGIYAHHFTASGRPLKEWAKIRQRLHIGQVPSAHGVQGQNYHTAFFSVLSAHFTNSAFLPTPLPRFG